MAGLAVRFNGFSRLLDDYSRYLLGIGRSARNVSSVLGQLKTFTDYLYEINIHNFNAVNVLVLEKYQVHLSQQKYSRYTVACKVQAVRTFFKYLLRAGHIKDNPADLITIPYPRRRLPKDILSKEEVESLLNAPDVSKDKGIRDRALLETFYSSGIRLTELCNLNVSDADTAKGILRVNNGKYSKDRVIPLGRVACHWIRLYRQTVRPDFLKNKSEQALFIGVRGKRIRQEIIQDLIKIYAKKSGIRKSVYPHLLRHSFASHLLSNGASTKDVQEMLGHQELDSTQIYLRVTGQELREMHSKYHPRELNGD